MKKTFFAAIMILSIIFLNLQAQLKRQAYTEGWITTAIDTFQVTNQTSIAPHITVTLDSLPNNFLQFRSNADTTWRTLHPDEYSYDYPRCACKYIYRRALADSVYSRVFAD